MRKKKEQIYRPPSKSYGGYYCEGCGKVARRDITERGDWEYQTCVKCGYRKRYRVR